MTHAEVHCIGNILHKLFVIRRAKLFSPGTSDRQQGTASVWKKSEHIYFDFNRIDLLRFHKLTFKHDTFSTTFSECPQFCFGMFLNCRHWDGAGGMYENMSEINQ